MKLYQNHSRNCMWRTTFATKSTFKHKARKHWTDRFDEWMANQNHSLQLPSYGIMKNKISFWFRKTKNVSNLNNHYNSWV